MKLAEALEIVQRPAVAGGEVLTVSLACGFEPLHLRTFLAAELMERCPRVRVDVETGLFDDLPGNIERAAGSAADAIAVVVEWPDLDPRLGLRRLGGWRADRLDDIVAGARSALGRVERAVAAAARHRRVTVLMPTLPLPPLFPQAPGQTGPHELALRSLVTDGALRLVGAPGVAIAGLQRIDQLSPLAIRRDVKGELTTGCPYSLGHASAVAALLAELVTPPVPRKGLITDLDDTLWAGVLDEVGPHGVSWTGDHHRHGLYQQLLASLAGAGVLLGVASRNDRGLVADALARRDLLVAPGVLYPLEVSWGRKSESIRRILETWNVAADAVVFIDDSGLERDEARASLPGLATRSIPADDDALWTFMEELRALFGKGELSPEDGLRRESIRARHALHGAHTASGGSGDFLASVGGALEFHVGAARRERALELINKTNQFNLNGRRRTEADLAGARQRGAELITVGYEDRYGPLGMIAALLVAPGDEGPAIETWAMSCRAFARRVEHHTLHYVFERFGAARVVAAFQPTAGNVAMRDFLASLDGRPPDGPLHISRATFERNAPPLVHSVHDAAT